MNAYMVWEGPYPDEGAALVFAETAREAKRLGWARVSWFERDSYFDVRVKRMRIFPEYLMSLYDGKQQVVEAPPTCDVCGTWGSPPRANGDGCEHCGGEIENEMKIEGTVIERGDLEGTATPGISPDGAWKH